MAKTKNIVVIFLVLSVILMTGCSTSENGDGGQDYNDLVPDSTNEDIPGESVAGNVLAVVDGEEIESEEVSNIQQLLSQQGQQISQEEALEQVINQKVLEQKVQQENIVVTTEEAEALLEQDLSMQGASLDDYKQQVESQGASYDVELENLKTQIATQNYLESQLEGQSFNVTEEEAQEFYNVYEEQAGQQVPSYEEIRPQIIQQLEQQKQQEAISEIIQELRSNVDVEYN